MAPPLLVAEFDWKVTLFAVIVIWLSSNITPPSEAILLVNALSLSESVHVSHLMTPPFNALF